MDKVVIYTDGACSGNPGPGGWGRVCSPSASMKRSCVAGKGETTNNRMELQAAIAALNTLKRPCEVQLYTDSQYVKGGITGWIHGWKKNGWKTAAKKPGEECRIVAGAGRGAETPQGQLALG